jgi:hypothetical protein
MMATLNCWVPQEQELFGGALLLLTRKGACSLAWRQSASRFMAVQKVVTVVCELRHSYAGRRPSLEES